MNFIGESQNTYVKENQMLSRERITVMASVASTEKIAPNVEFIFKGKGTRTKLNPTTNVIGNGNIQVKCTDLHHSPKTIYHNEESQLIY